MKTEAEIELDQTIVRRMKAIRLSRGLDLNDVAKQIGVTKQFLSSVEGGLRSLSAGRMVLIARILGVTPNQLVGVDPVEPTLPW